MKTVVQQWGNSLAIRIPRHLAREAKVERGSEIEAESKNGSIILRPARKRRSYVLTSLVKKISPKNRHAKVDFSPPVGREVW